MNHFYRISTDSAVIPIVNALKGGHMAMAHGLAKQLARALATSLNADGIENVEMLQFLSAERKPLPAHRPGCMRYHVILANEEGVLLTSADEAVPAKTGEIWWIDVGEEIRAEVINRSGDDALHLMIDLRLG